jgi:undecaprenyl-diphosphatase
MGFTIDQILPSIQSLGVFGYWIIGAASLLEAFFITGVFVPGTLIVDAGGILVQRGVLDFLDLVWFVAIGSVLGCEASYWTGRLAKSRLREGSRFLKSGAYKRAQALFAGRGGLALVLGRFSGPVAGLVPLVAALTGIDRRTFVIWNVVGSVPFALVHVAIGYALGGAFGYLSGTLTRIALLVGLLALLLALIWWILLWLFRLMPIAFSLTKAVLLAVAERPTVVRWFVAHPKAERRIAARFDRETFTGLPLTCLSLVFGYILIVWADVTLDFVLASPSFALDANVAQFVHLFWTPAFLRTAAFMTAIGDRQVIAALLVATLVWLALRRRWDLAAGLVIALVGNILSVAILKHIFARPRPGLAYFAETSGSFPSGHAAISVAFYATLAYVLWRAGRIGQVTAVMAASILAFAIGISRVLLAEHYLTDVLNGWLVGGLWMLVGVTVAEWRLHRRGETPELPRAAFIGVVALACVSLLVSFGAWRVITYDKLLSAPSALQTEQVVENPRNVLSAASRQGVTTSLAGDVSLPVNLIIVAPSQADLTRNLTQIGWSLASEPTLGRLIEFGFSMIRDRTDPSTMVFPLFWSGMPNAMAMQADIMGKAPLVARFWKSSFLKGDGSQIFVGSVAPDERLGDTKPSRDAIRRARDRLIIDMLAVQSGIATPDTPDGGIPVIEIR